MHVFRRVINEIAGLEHEFTLALVVHLHPAAGNVHDLKIVVVVMQAGAMGLPSIVTNINGCNEIISEGINGRIIPVKDVQALYDAMRSLAENTAERRRMQSVSREIIDKNYKQAYIWNELLKLYQSTLNPNDL